MENGILDILTVGVIAVDASGHVQAFNKKARLVFGIEEQSGTEYDSGKLETNDIVILASTSVGQDDGRLDSDTLKKLNFSGEISPGAAIAAIGTVGTEGSPIVRHLPKSEVGTKLEMTYVYSKRRISVRIDLAERIIDIIVDGRSFPVHYIQSFGHMVVLNGRTGRVKFVQSHGYSFRKEAIGDLLRGGRFEARVGGRQIDLIGTRLVDVLNEPELADRLMKTASGNGKGFEGKYMNIHGRPMLGSVYPIQCGDSEPAAVLTVEDISEFDVLIKERNAALKELESIRRELLCSHDDPIPEIIGSSICMNRVKQLSKSAANSRSTVLLLGESGTGKNVVAQAIHRHSALSDKPFVQVNCGALPEHLIESELFGYAAGAFTGANSKGKPGFFELADGGTLFLDEVGEIPLQVQVKLLHAIQSHQFYRVGGTKPIEVNVRLIAATNRDLESAVLAGAFREDLYYRLNVLRILIPPLRERREDIRELSEALLPRICKRLSMKSVAMSRDALYILQNHSFSGNVRELENTLERAVNLSQGGLIMPEHLLLDRLGRAGESAPVQEDIKTLREVVQQAEKSSILKALERSKGDREQAMKWLGIGKSSFYEKVKKYAIGI